MATKPIQSAEEIFSVSTDYVISNNSSITGMIPNTPWVEIQFRTNIIDTETSLTKLTPSENNEWTTVTLRAADLDTYSPPTKQEDESSLKFDNYFENVTLEDNGGLVNCSLTLYDKELGRLENIIVKSMMATKSGNELIKNKLSEAPTNAILNFVNDPSSSINFRLRFGYSDPSTNDNTYSPALKGSSDWQDRTKTSHQKAFYKKSPWLYFMMMDVVFALNQNGLTADIKGISMSNTFLDRTKILKRFALMQGTPQKLLKNLGEQIYAATNGYVQVIEGQSAGRTSNSTAKPILPEGVSTAYGDISDYGEPSDLPIQWSVTDNTQDSYPDNVPSSVKKELQEDSKWLNISISLGGEPRYEVGPDGKTTQKIINEYMSLRNLLTDFVNKCPSILRNKNTDKYITDGNKIKEIMDNTNNRYDPTVFESVAYTYSVNEVTLDLGDDNASTQTVVLIRFFYKRLDKTKQEYIRSYDYMNAPRTLIKNFGVKSSMDFIQLNQAVAVIAEDLMTTVSTATETIDGNEGSTPADVTSLMKQKLNNGKFSLVGKIIENDGSTSSNLVSNSFIKTMNEGIFAGNIDIIGDPFYLFDSNLQPYQYFIRLNIYRTKNEYNKKNIDMLQQSYLSGYYLITKIVHNLSSSGFTTTLSLQRYSTTGFDS